MERNDKLRWAFLVSILRGSMKHPDYIREKIDVAFNTNPDKLRAYLDGPNREYFDAIMRQP